jgi:hypothetical protein
MSRKPSRALLKYQPSTFTLISSFNPSAHAREGGRVVSNNPPTDLQERKLFLEKAILDPDKKRERIEQE